MLKTLSLVVTEEGRDAPALAAAAAIARREDAHLDVACLGIEPVPVETMAMGATPMVVDTGRAEALERAEALAAWARAALPPDLRANVEPLTVQGLGLATVVARAARFADLIVTARPYGPHHGTLAPVVAEGLILGTGAPVLVVPDSGATDWSRRFRRLVLAWNDSDTALHAVRAALPILRDAGAVDIVMVEPPVHAHDRADPGHALCAWLARHDVRAEVAVLPRTEPRTADILARFAAERGCDAIVMGAFGHSRLREAVLGGTTRDMLASVPLPLVMAH